MSTVSIEPIKLSRSSLSCAFSIGLYLAWWSIYHEEGFLFLEPLSVQTFSCVVSFLGISLAGITALLMHRHMGSTDLLQIFDWKILGLQLASGLILDSGIIAGNVPLCVSLQTLVGALAFFPFILISAKLFGMEAQEIVSTIAIGLAVFSLTQLLMFGLTAVVPSFAFRILLHTAILFAAFFAIRTFFRTHKEKNTAPDKESALSVPFPLAFHIVAYSLIFGMTHALASGVVTIPIEKVLPSYLGSLLAAFLFFLVLSWNKGIGQIWPKIRAVVFPTTVLSFILLPLAQNGSAFFSVMIAECASANYFAIFFFACIVIARKTGIAPTRITALGMALSAPAFAFGVLSADIIKMVLQLDAAVYAVLTACAFIILTAGTFWVGDDKKAALVWGMEKKLTPKKFNDLVLQKKCQKLSDEYKLTGREQEILLLITQGKSAASIAKSEVVSLNTIRTHIAHIHRKLAIHTQQELMDLIESTETI